MSPLAARVPRQPITFMYGNLVWGPFSDEVWALYALEMHSYEGRPRRGKIDLMGDLADAADGLEADFQLLRISRQWSLDDVDQQRVGHAPSPGGRRDASGDAGARPAPYAGAARTRGGRRWWRRSRPLRDRFRPAYRRSARAAHCR
jgi:hypothetical protein